jgi:hypothetical protein
VGIPIFEKKHFLPQNSDIPKHISKVVEGGDSVGLYSDGSELFFLKGDRPQNILDSNEGWNPGIIPVPKISHLSTLPRCKPKVGEWVLLIPGV